MVLWHRSRVKTHIRGFTKNLIPWTPWIPTTVELLGNLVDVLWGADRGYTYISPGKFENILQTFTEGLNYLANMIQNQRYWFLSELFVVARVFLSVFLLVSSCHLMAFDIEKNIVETAISAEEFSTLAAALETAGLVDTLSGEGPFTVFAPNDKAFAGIPSEQIAALLADTEQLTALLSYHIVPGKIMSADIHGITTATTLQGSDVDITLFDGDLRIGGANLIQTDIETSNGVIHVIDQVILPTPRSVRASALFAGPGQFPPLDFRAYGILAFSSRVNEGNRNRYESICKGYLSAIPAVNRLERRGVAINDQMVTVWPLDERNLADSLNQSSQSLEKCGDVISSIDLITSREAMADARLADQDVEFRGAGPYLIAWSPAGQKGELDVPVLVVDLTDVTNVEQATSIFGDWIEKIEGDPNLWSNGWNLERVRIQIMLWADKHGTSIMRFFGVGAE